MAPKRKPYSQLSKSAKFYRKNKKSRDKKKKYDTALNARKSQIKKRVESASKRRAAKRAGKNIKNRDYDHSSNSFISVKKNRGKKGEGNRKKKRR